jgi:hypothetical protein
VGVSEAAGVAAVHLAEGAVRRMVLELGEFGCLRGISFMFGLELVIDIEKGGG